MFSTGDQAPASVHLPGRHLMLELYGCPAARLTDAVRIERSLRDAAHAAGVNVLAVAMHVFAGGGLTCVMVLGESHLSIHTWPEHAYAAVDLFTCGAGTFEVAVAILREDLEATHIEQRVVARGRSLQEPESSVTDSSRRQASSPP